MEKLEHTPMSDNELIAEFMGGWNDNNNSRYLGMNVPADGNPHWEDQWYDYKDMKYSTSWDWLMPVVEKVETEKFSVMIIGKYTRIQRPHPYKEFATDICDSKILSVYNAVVEFIKWHNANTYER